ncbi:porin [Prevotella dentasini]|uniref:porin n=1 Tax=Prevotella dentasini TaxID=589537 RepID=UPI0004696D9C|nr:porin [Prevotella dentasini]
MKTTCTLLLLLALGWTTAKAQEKLPVDLKVEARGDYQRTSIDGEDIKDECGFKGNIVDVVLKGELSPKFSYAYRQRLNGINKDYKFFDATDWLFLKYKATDQLAVSAGKYVVLVAGWELDPAPIDCYYLSEFCYNFACYQWGVSAEYQTKSGNDAFTLQACQSPFSKQHPDTYAYNLMWHGRHGFYEPLWSVNAIEYEKGKFFSYISLGNRFHIGEKVQVDFDFMNRAAKGQTFFGRDCTISGQISYRPTQKFHLFTKMSYDVNNTGSAADKAVQDGTEITRVGAGFEYFPLKDNRVRIHGNYSYSFGKNSNPNGVVQDKLSALNVGVTWRVKVL